MKRFFGTLLLGSFFYMLICGFVFPVRQAAPARLFFASASQIEAFSVSPEDFSRPQPLESFADSVLSADLFSRSV